MRFDPLSDLIGPAETTAIDSQTLVAAMNEALDAIDLGRRSACCGGTELPLEDRVVMLEAALLALATIVGRHAAAADT